MNKQTKKRVRFLLFAALFLTSIFFLSSEKSKLRAAENISVEMTAGNTWESSGSTFVQVDGTVTNNGTSSVKDWTVSVPIGSNGSVSNNWNCSFDMNGDTLTITGADSSKSIPSKKSVSFGIILTNVKDFDEEKATVSIGSAPSSSQEPGSTPSQDDTDTVSKPVPAPSTDDWLHTDGSNILDKNGNKVWLTGVNWFGYNTGTNIFDGVWSCDLDSTLKAIANRGFNLLRIPFSSELILQWKSGKYPKPCYNDYVNTNLSGMNSLEIFDHVVEQCRANGMKIMIDIHSAETNAAGHFAPLWYTEKISEKDYLGSLSWMADRYKNDDTIIAYDLKNEPHGAAGDSEKAIWNDSTSPNNWKYVAEKAALAVLSENPNALVMVEGIQIYPKDINTNKDYSSKSIHDYYNTWWGGNLRGVKDFPVDLGKYQDKLVYSPHDYGPTVSDQPWFSGSYTQESLYEDCWRDNWMYIQEDNIAPLLIGEWGGFMTSPNIKWMTYMRDFIIEHKINHTFWCFNANSGDTGGLVMHDFTTWDEEKYNFVKKALWQKGGKFVGLDQKIPLGTNGISLSQY